MLEKQAMAVWKKLHLPL